MTTGNKSVPKCKKCQSELIVAGFERKLITRGKDKGMSIVRDLLRCPNRECPSHVRV